MKRRLMFSCMKEIALSAVFIGVNSVSMSASAQSSPDATPAATPAPADPPIASFWGFDLSGYIDAAYSNLSGYGGFNTTPAGPGITIGGPNRVFDYRRNSLQLHQVALTLANQPKEGFGALINVTFGRDADVIAAYDTGPSNGDGCNLVTGQSNTGSCNRIGYDFTQAFVQYATGPATFILGKYVTLAGAEVISSTADTNFSRSILFGYAIPFSHTGFRASYAVSDALTLIAGVNNGWDDLKDTNSAKTVELGISLTPSKDFSFTGQVYSGKERVGGLVNSGPEGTRNLFDAVATFNATDKLTFILNYDYGTQANASSATVTGVSKAKWSGIAGYVNYQIVDNWRVSLRGEYFGDSDGYRTGVAQKWKEATLTLGYTPIKNLELRGEVRRDQSDVPSFINSDISSASKNQRSIALEAIYKF